ncbi:MAG: PGF-CTERM sorting domain-containing protein [Halobacteriota archaeon]|nr:PGF-CTERM sorting domain-containing protein [Halobacteriota archaeon]
MRRIVLYIAALIVGMLLVSPVLGAYSDGCSCHKSMDPTVEEAAYLSSVHGASECTGCHVGVPSPHPGTPVTSVNCNSEECHGAEITKDANWNAENHDAIAAAPPTPTPEEPPAAVEGETPGFTVIFAVAGLIAVAFLMRRR